MDSIQRIIEEVKNGILSKFPLLGSVMVNLQFVVNTQIDTAATNGHEVMYSPDFVKSLSHEERIFLFAHEVMHVAFDHLQRSVNKNHQTWNEATDAVINQILKQAGLPMLEGCIDIPDALNKSADEMYDVLFQNKLQEQNQAREGQTQSEQKQGHQQPVNHNLWNKVSEQTQIKQNTEGMSNHEKNFTQVNEKLKEEIGKKIRKQLQEESDQAKQAGNSGGGKKSYLGAVGEAQAIMSWQQILRRELDHEEERWSYRRADEDNDFQPRLEDMEICDLAIVEVLIDTSGSVDDQLLRSFLCQIKHLLKNAKLMVGCFDHQFYGFKEIKKMKDIDNFQIVGRGGTDFDLALASFSRDPKVNKIIFTDGFDRVTESNENKKVKNLYWLVWANDLFKPCCGKVVFVDRYAMNYQKNKLTTCTIQPKILPHTYEVNK